MISGCNLCRKQSYSSTARRAIDVLLLTVSQLRPLTTPQIKNMGRRIASEQIDSEEPMFCPRCGTSQSEELKFCKSCGANLSAVRQVVDGREAAEKFDWNKTWVTEMFLSAAEKKARR